MPYQVIVNTNPANPYAEIEFLDDSGNKVNTPGGAVAAFTSDNPGIVAIDPDPNNSLRGKITLPLANPVMGTAMIHIQISGANDTNNQPFSDQYIQATAMPAVPAKPASIMFHLTAPPTPPVTAMMEPVTTQEPAQQPAS